MKKILIILIAALTLLAVTLTVVAGTILASKKKAETPSPTESLALTEEVTTEAAQETEAPTTEAATEPTVSHIEKDEPTVPPTTAPTEPKEPKEQEFGGIVFKPVDRTVYATARANVRTGPSVESRSIGKLEVGSAVEQIGISDKKWSRIWFQGQKAFVATEYLTSEKPSSQKPQAPQEPLPQMDSVNDKVYAVTSLNVRSGPGRAYEKIGYLKESQGADRVAITKNGWSKIRYNSGYGYVSNEYLRNTEKEPVYQKVDETVYATDLLNLRTGPSTYHTVSAKLKAGESVKRTAVGDNGWSEVKYQGSTLYASSKYLTTKAPGSEETAPTEKPAEKPQKPQKPAFPDCKPVDETVFATQTLIIYSGPGTNYPTLGGSISKDRPVHRTGIYENGMSRVVLGDKEVYVVSAYLTDQKPQQPSEPAPTEKPADPPKDEEEEAGYTPNKATVYSTADDVNVRSQPSTSSKKLGKVHKGTPVDRLAIGDDGWTKVLFEDQKAYISSVFLTEKSQEEEKPQQEQQTFRDVEETVYSIDSVHVRKAPDFDADSLGQLFYGDSIRRTGIGDKGWSRVDWDGKTAYVYSKYLSAEEPEMPDFGDTTTPDFPTPNSPFIYQYVDNDGVIPHAVFLPAAGDVSPLPVIMTLHGSAEVHRDREFMEQQHLTKVFREWEYTALDPIPALVVNPHISKNVPFEDWGTPAGAEAILKLIDYLDENYDIDRNNIILEGHSMGGQGALYMAATHPDTFRKLVVVSGYDAGQDYSKITIPVRGCVGGGPGSEGPKDSPHIYEFMTGTFADKFGKENLYVGPYTHDDVAIKFFKKDKDGNGKSDIIEWMLAD